MEDALSHIERNKALHAKILPMPLLSTSTAAFMGLGFVCRNKAPFRSVLRDVAVKAKRPAKCKDTSGPRPREGTGPSGRGSHRQRRPNRGYHGKVVGDEQGPGAVPRDPAIGTQLQNGLQGLEGQPSHRERADLTRRGRSGT